eukprot:GEZU01014857.1.p1 GENE.GEZU01014857.1~~GEZU01014857.1.p1  ORF type:complete len:255 (-),score=55.83 GEZU01014857.1:39-803(-)
MFKSSKAILLIPVNEVTVIPKTESILMRISEIVTNWNVNYQYHETSTSIRERRGNCQTFVDMFLDSLKIAKSWSENGLIANNLAKLKEVPVTSVLKIWDENNVQHEFSCHADLRRFYEEQVAAGKITPKSPKQWSHLDPDYELRTLLKSVERVFQLRYELYKSTDDEERIRRYIVVSPIFPPSPSANMYDNGYDSYDENSNDSSSNDNDSDNYSRSFGITSNTSSGGEMTSAVVYEGTGHSHSYSHRKAATGLI